MYNIGKTKIDKVIEDGTTTFSFNGTPFFSMKSNFKVTDYKDKKGNVLGTCITVKDPLAGKYYLVVVEAGHYIRKSENTVCDIIGCLVKDRKSFSEKIS